METFRQSTPKEQPKSVKRGDGIYQEGSSKEMGSKISIESSAKSLDICISYDCREAIDLYQVCYCTFVKMSIPLQTFRPRQTNHGGVPTSSTTSLMDHWKNYCIYEVPAHIKAQNPRAYNPQLVSIGPYHHGEPHLLAMEEHKARALHRFLERTGKVYKAYYEALKDKYEVMVNSYQSLSDEKWKGVGSDRFLQLMVLDGAFLYEFMRGFTDGWDYEDRDPVFSLRALLNICPYILPDILMLENQLPLTVLERLIAVAKGKPNQTYDEEVYNLVFKFFFVEPPSNMPKIGLGFHVLDVTRKVITREFEQIVNHHNEPAFAVKSALELHGAGVKFVKSEIPGNRGVSFDKGILKLPLLTFDSTTEPLFLNAIAFEYLHPDANHEVCSYVAFMRGLIASPNDANYLMSLKLIQSSIGDHQAVAAGMKTISKNVFFDPLSDLCKVGDSLNKYYDDHTGEWDRRLREWWRTLHQNYLKNPWTIIAVIGATIILILTLLQTIYTMKGYFEGNNKN